MRRRRYYKRKKGKKRGRGIPYIYKNIPQTGTGVVSQVISCLLENVGDVTGLQFSKRNIGENEIENLRENIREKLEVGVLETDLNYYILLENSGVSQCNEAQKELCDGKTAGAKKSDFTQRQDFSSVL